MRELRPLVRAVDNVVWGNILLSGLFGGCGERVGRRLKERENMSGVGQSIKTVVLLGALTGLLMAIGGLVGGNVGMTVALGVSLLMNMGAWWFSDRMVIAMTRARPVTEAEAPRLHRMVEELSRNAGIPKPRVYVVPDRTPNAFATGRGPGHAVVAVTQGLQELLSEREIRGVLAHELAHIQNRDILVSSVAAAIAGAVMWLANMAQWAMLFGGVGRGDDEEGPNPLVLLVTAILAPLAATVIQMAISRSREYKADSRGAEISRDPGALADALARLDAGVHRRPSQNGSAATVHCIVNSFSGRSMLRLFSTHPPIEDRIARLREMVRAGRIRGA